jgi:hypothetical protein
MQARLGVDISTTRSPNSTKLHTSHPEMVDSKRELSKWKEHVCRDPKCALVHRKGPGPPAIFLPTTSPPAKDPDCQSSVATHKTLLQIALCFSNTFRLSGNKNIGVFPAGDNKCSFCRRSPSPSYPSCQFFMRIPHQHFRHW